MSDESSGNKALTAQTVQAAIGSILGVFVAYFLPKDLAVTAPAIASVAALVIVWGANRWIKQDELDRASNEQLRPILKLLEELEQRLSLLPPEAPERRQLQKQAAGLREARYQLVIRGATVIQPAITPSPPESTPNA